MAAKTSTTLCVFPPVSFSLKDLSSVFFLMESDKKEVKKAEINKKTIKCGHSSIKMLT